MTMRTPLLQLFGLLVSFYTIAQAASAVPTPRGFEHGYVVEGRVRLEGLGARVLPSKSLNVKVILNGGQQLTFVRPDGYFALILLDSWVSQNGYVSSLHFYHGISYDSRTTYLLRYCLLPEFIMRQGVTAGTHLLEVSALGYSFSPVRVDVSARLHGQVRALAVETRRYYSDALILEPIREEYYYERREPFSAMGLLKSPMGLMVGFMLVAIFLLPKLMDSIDPEEMKRVQEEMRNQPAPSFSNLLQGRSQ